ncbi:MAG: alpha-L-rhamnosidase N-terminal domain-containing protein, partial [Phycisphaerae bacterium]|nr:alpha-L-rhamnosidase N-terminal domain-containing protein [Phycisphaerae bacterium]
MSRTQRMTGKGQWIWLRETCDNVVNLRVLARKCVTPRDVSNAELLISADTRYRLWINGLWVTDGPARSFPRRYAYDRVDVSEFLQPGENVIAVVAHHFGEGTFQSLVVQPGLIVELHADGEVIGSDDSWKMIVDPTYNRHSPRVCSQLFHEEHVDARDDPVGWRETGYDDSGWPTAKIVAGIADGPWKLTPRDIPLLAHETVPAQSVREVRTVRPPKFIRVLNLDRAFRPGDTKSGIKIYNGAVLTSIESPRAQKVRWIQPDGIGCVCRYLNGIEVNETETVELRKGSNIFYAVIEGTHDQGDFQIILDTEADVSLRNPLGQDEWAVAGPFDPVDPAWEDKIYVGIPADNGSKACNSDDPTFAAMKKARTLEDIRDQDLLIHFKAAPDFAEVGPDVQAMIVHAIQTEEGDTEVLYDFGRELNAYFEMELTAPAGVVIDATCFETFRDGRPQYTGRYRVGFRHVTREGRQSFTTAHHYGMRYLLLTIRGNKKLPAWPNVSAIFVHYPVENRGAFECSDPVLNDIWTAGRHTLLCCMEDTFTDCPTYEQACWVADARIEALVCHAAFGDTLLSRRCIRLAAESLRQKDLTNCHVPSSWRHIMPTWSFLWVRMVWEYFEYSGDIS